VALTVLAPLGVIALLALIREQGASTAVAEALAQSSAEQSSAEPASAGAAPEVEPKAVAARFDARAAEELVARVARDAGLRCGLAAATPLRLTVTFDPSGRAAALEVKEAWGETRAGRCVGRALQVLTVPPFSGPQAEVQIAVEPLASSKR
jgi:pyruvate/2-oxoglutarate dehydrogenase complex dihydrolipoamide acyltransferase (E2) component